MDNWYILDRLDALVTGLADPNRAERAQRLFAPLAANLADVLSSPAKRREVADGARRATEVLDSIRTAHDLDEASPAFLAGRLTTVVDTLALLARARSADDLVELAKAEIKTLQALYDGPQSNIDVASARGITEEAACRSLRVCRALNLVETERRGRVNVNRLTRLTQSLFDDGFLPLMDKVEYDMKRVIRVTKAADLTMEPGLPQISVGR